MLDHDDDAFVCLRSNACLFGVLDAESAQTNKQKRKIEREEKKSQENYFSLNEIFGRFSLSATHPGYLTKLHCITRCFYLFKCVYLQLTHFLFTTI